MRRLCLTVIVVAVFLASASAASSVRPQTLFFDATFTNLRTHGPAANAVGHVQSASGILHDATGHALGRFAFTCRWVETLSNGNARERCSGWGHTAEGRLNFAGAGRANDATHNWRLTGVAGSYRGASGRIVPRDLGQRESLVLVTIRPRTGVKLHLGAIPRPPANAPFVSHANAICAAAETKMSALPPFPYQNFDPLHPDRALLRKVGSFFNSSANPRPTLHALQRQLATLGQPPRNRNAWTKVLRTLAAKTAIFGEQVRAATTDDTTAWVNETKAAISADRRLLIADAVFGTTNCTF
jgi:hypothetical protein